MRTSYNLKDPLQFTEAEKIIGRVNTYVEIEKLTGVPFPRNVEFGNRTDGYMSELSACSEVLAAKADLGKKVVEQAWGEDLQTIDGWFDLSHRRPQMPVRFYVGSRELFLSLGTLELKTAGSECSAEDVAHILCEAGSKKVYFHEHGVIRRIQRVRFTEGTLCLDL